MTKKIFISQNWHAENFETNEDRQELIDIIKMMSDSLNDTNPEFAAGLTNSIESLGNSQVKDNKDIGQHQIQQTHQLTNRDH